MTTWQTAAKFVGVFALGYQINDRPGVGILINVNYNYFSQPLLV